MPYASSPEGDRAGTSFVRGLWCARASLGTGDGTELEPRMLAMAVGRQGSRRCMARDNAYYEATVERLETLNLGILRFIIAAPNRKRRYIRGVTGLRGRRTAGMAGECRPCWESGIWTSAELLGAQAQRGSRLVRVHPLLGAAPKAYPFERQTTTRGRFARAGCGVNDWCRRLRPDCQLHLRSRDSLNWWSISVILGVGYGSVTDIVQYGRHRWILRGCWGGTLAWGGNWRSRRISRARP